MLESFDVVEKKVLDSIEFLLDLKEIKFTKVEIFIAIHQKSYIKYEDSEGEKNRFISILEYNEIFENLQKNGFEFPSALQELKINLTSKDVPVFNAVYIPRLES